MNDTDRRSQINLVNAEYWNAIDGDRTLRLNYDLDKDSVVFDLGGYQGEWAEQIYQRYRCRILVFEPVPDFASGIRERFRGNDDVSVFECALGAKAGKLQLALNDNATSSYVSGDSGFVEAEIKEFIAFLGEHDIRKIDLLKINIEGGEFELLDHLISTGCISRIGHIQVQFHSFVPGAQKRVEDIRGRLWQTHAPTYSLDWIWDSWTQTTDLVSRKTVLERGLHWHQETVRGMSASASTYACRTRELPRLEKDSRILNAWRRRLSIVLRIRNLVRRWK